MPKSFKLRRNLNDAFIVVTDDEENKTSDESANVCDSPSTSSRSLDRRSFDKKRLGSIGKSSYSRDHFARNYNLLSPSEFHPKNDNKTKPGILKRSGSVTANSESKTKPKIVRFSQTRRSLQNNHPPLVDISNMETPDFSRTLRRSNFEKTSESRLSREREGIEKNIYSNKHSSRKSYPGCTTAKLSPLCPQRHAQYKMAKNFVPEVNADTEAPGPLPLVSLQTARNLTVWRRGESNVGESYTNLESLVQTDRPERNISNVENGFRERPCFEVRAKAATNDTERNNNCQFASSTQNLAAVTYCSNAQWNLNNLNTETKTQEVGLQNDLSEVCSCHARTQSLQRHINRFEEFLSKVGGNHDFLNPVLWTKQAYYERSKVDLTEFEREARNEVNRNNLNSTSNAKYACNIEGPEQSAQRMNLNESTAENWPENVFMPEEKAAKNDSPNRQINLVSTPESPISTLMSKNLMELDISKIINRTPHSQVRKIACSGNKTDCEGFNAEDQNKTESKHPERSPGGSSNSENESE